LGFTTEGTEDAEENLTTDHTDTIDFHGSEQKFARDRAKEYRDKEYRAEE
jgi:hypothetical protein